MPAKIDNMQVAKELQDTYYCNCNNRAIARLSEALSGKNNEAPVIVKNVYKYVRDNIKFGFDAVNIKASETLAKGFGACWNKALLMVALLRNLKIQSRVVCDPVKRTFSKPCFGLICHL